MVRHHFYSACICYLLIRSFELFSFRVKHHHAFRHPLVRLCISHSRRKGISRGVSQELANTINSVGIRAMSDAERSTYLVSTPFECQDKTPIWPIYDPREGRQGTRSPPLMGIELGLGRERLTTRMYQTCCPPSPKIGRSWGWEGRASKAGGV